MEYSLTLEKFITILTSTLYFKVDISPKVNYEINEYRLIEEQSEQEVDEEIQEPEIWNYFGKIFKTGLLHTPYFIREEPFKDPDEIGRLFILSYELFDNFFTVLWFIKDNSCNANQIGVFYYKSDEEQRSVLGSTVQKNTNAKAEFEDVTFNEFELIEAGNINAEILKSINKRKDETQFPILTGSSITVGRQDDYEYNEHKRISRAINFLKLARYSVNLPQKISFYVLVLECLFIPKGNTEILNRLHSRVAAYIGTDSEDRERISKFIKKSYDIRSRFFHGDELNNSHKTIAKLKILSVDLDNLLRLILTKVIINDSEFFLKNSDELSDWFDEQKLDNV